jgi:hypothetical protein
VEKREGMELRQIKYSYKGLQTACSATATIEQFATPLFGIYNFYLALSLIPTIIIEVETWSPQTISS